MITLLTILACLIPTIIWVALIYSVDRYEKEPLWLLGAVFIWGAFPSVVLAIVFNQFFSASAIPLISSNWRSLTSTALIAPLVEETVKGLALLGVLFWRRNDIDSILDGVIYGAMVGMGFAMVENYFYFSSEYANGGFQAWRLNVFFRALVFGLNHALFSALFGLGVAYSRLSKNEMVRIVAPIFGWASGVFVHAIHNATVGLSTALCFIAPVVDYSGIFLTGLIMIWSLRQEGEWINTYLKEEVMFGTLTFRQFELASNPAERRALRNSMISQLQLGRYLKIRRFLSLCSKLAYQKHHGDIHPDDDRDTTIAELRQEILDLGRAV